MCSSIVCPLDGDKEPWFSCYIIWQKPRTFGPIAAQQCSSRGSESLLQLLVRGWESHLSVLVDSNYLAANECFTLTDSLTECSASSCRSLAAASARVHITVFSLCPQTTPVTFTVQLCSSKITHCSLFRACVVLKYVENTAWRKAKSPNVPRQCKECQRSS